MLWRQPFFDATAGIVPIPPEDYPHAYGLVGTWIAASVRPPPPFLSPSTLTLNPAPGAVRVGGADVPGGRWDFLAPLGGLPEAQGL